MTLIEFFEKDALENICTCLTVAPDRVYLIGGINEKKMTAYAEKYKQVLDRRELYTEIICKAVSKNDLQDIVEKLSKIVEECDDCIFDLTGGEDLCLVAAGIVYEKYKDRGIQLHRFNVRNNTIVDADRDGDTVVGSFAPQLSIEENVRIYGGEIVYEEVKEGKTFDWRMDREFERDIDSMWEVCRVDVQFWNAAIGMFADAEKMRDTSREELNTTVTVPHFKEYLKRNNHSYIKPRRILRDLKKYGILTDYSCDDDVFSVTYKNEQVKYCLNVAGQALEMKIYLSALRAAEKDKTRIYNDVMNGVYIDWDGDIHTEQDGYDTENEIDVLMMHGMVPVFVSCKNGQVDIDELYKLNAVAEKFGGKYSRKVLVATALPDSDFTGYLKMRAKDMGIRVVDDILKMDDERLIKEVGTFWYKN